MTVAILGCGYTGRRLAARLEQRGVTVLRTTRTGFIPLDVTKPFDLSFIPAGAVVAVSIPTTRPDGTPALVEQLRTRGISRLIYLSTTGVYGQAKRVDHTTPVESHERVPVEQAYAAGPWPALILRPAAIYGPGRGVHARMARGDYTLPGDGSNYVSRIHVDDLAAIVDAAAGHTVTGAFPVADDEPCTSREMADFCSHLLGLPRVPDGGNTRGSRRVDGGEIRRLLGIELRYSSYREGVPAAIRAAELCSNCTF